MENINTNIQTKFNYSLKSHNTFGLDVYCSRFVEFSDIVGLREIISRADNNDKPLFVIGGGSNLLFTGDYDGTILHSAIKGFDYTFSENDVFLRCGSGEQWDDVVSLCVRNGWFGAENLSLIPGEVGASAVQNIGAYGVEAKDLICKVEAVDLKTGELHEFLNEDCCYSYRFSRFKSEWKGRFAITYVTYRLSKVFEPKLDYGNIRAELESRGIINPDALQLRNVIIDIRNAKLPDPNIEGNAGSFFMNPVVPVTKYEEIAAKYDKVPHYPIDESHVKIPAGWLIDKCGWKGKRLGCAGVHARQALVLVNLGGATGHDIMRLSDTVRGDVKERFGIDIFPEVNII